MSSVVLVLGTDHRYQTESSDFTAQNHRAFDHFVRKSVAEGKALAIAEESSPQALTEAGVEQSVPERIARSLRIEHRHCDPDRKTRAELGVMQEIDIRMSEFPRKLSERDVQDKLDSSHRARENFWLRQLLDLNVWPVLFVCGANHVESFVELLRDRGLEPKLIALDWSA